VDLSQHAPLIQPSKSEEGSVKGARGAKRLTIMELHQMMQRKKDWSKNIATYQLIDGHFRPKISDEELKR
jgi:hypothetical protein